MFVLFENIGSFNGTDRGITFPDDVGLSALASFVDVRHHLPAGLLSQFTLYSNLRNQIGAVRLQIWRRLGNSSTFRLMWENRVVVNGTTDGELAMYSVSYTIDCRNIRSTISDTVDKPFEIVHFRSHQIRHHEV